MTTWNSEGKRAFEKAFNGHPNVMTPTPKAYGRRKGRFYEVSWGEGFRGSEIWGVTVLTPDGLPDHSLSRCFSSEREALAYIKAGFAERAPA